MNLSVNDYGNLYRLQDKVFEAMSGYYGSLYLTGGTALGRFYLNHRYSDDIDLFSNADDSFKVTVNKIRNIFDKQFDTSTSKLILYDEFIRIWVKDDACELKVEFVNDVEARWGEPIQRHNIAVDNPGNILANKLTALIGRDYSYLLNDKEASITTFIYGNSNTIWKELQPEGVEFAIA